MPFCAAVGCVGGIAGVAVDAAEGLLVAGVVAVGALDAEDVAAAVGAVLAFFYFFLEVLVMQSMRPSSGAETCKSVQAGGVVNIAVAVVVAGIGIVVLFRAPRGGGQERRLPYSL